MARQQRVRWSLYRDCVAVEVCSVNTNESNTVLLPSVKLLSTLRIVSGDGRSAMRLIDGERCAKGKAILIHWMEDVSLPCLLYSLHSDNTSPACVYSHYAIDCGQSEWRVHLCKRHKHHCEPHRYGLTNTTCSRSAFAVVDKPHDVATTGHLHNTISHSSPQQSEVVQRRNDSHPHETSNQTQYRKHRPTATHHKPDTHPMPRRTKHKQARTSKSR